MSSFLTYTVIGIVVGCIYALTATGLVVTYTTSGVFNFAHGAIGMIAAFSYWQLTVGWGLPPLVALLVVLLVGAPLFGAVIERTLMRRLEGAALEVQLVVTVGLLALLIGVANLAWNPTRATRTLPRFFAGHKVKLLLVYVDFHEITVVLIAAAVAVALRLFFARSRTGVAMRAVVDNSDLAAMTGARPHRIAQLSWALGAGLAALAGILLAPLQYLDINLLTLVIINAIAAAVFGKFRSLPLAVAGSLLLGLLVTYAVGYLPVGGFLSKIQTAIPMAVLFLALIVMKQDRLRTARLAVLQMPRVPGLRQSLVGAAAFVAAAVFVSGHLSGVNLATGGRALAFGLVMLSLVLLTGYGGQVSLCQLTFVGLGAYAMGHAGHHGSPLGVLTAIVLAAGFGAVMALPTLKLRGLYLALATLAFGQAMDYIFFGNVFGAYGGGLDVDRLHLPGVSAGSDRAYFVLLAVVFAVAAVGVLAVRRGRYGRRLAALNDSPAACATLGANINYTKLAVFTASAGLAGIAGALYGGLQHIVTPNDFQVFTSLLILLMLLVGGRNTVTGAFLAAVLFSLFPVLQQHVPSLANIQSLLVGLAAITIGRNPNGIGGQLSDTGDRLRAALSGRRGAPAPDQIVPEERLAGATG